MGDLFNGGLSFLLILGGSAGECCCSLVLISNVDKFVPEDDAASLPTIDVESLVFLPGFNSL